MSEITGTSQDTGAGTSAGTAQQSENGAASEGSSTGSGGIPADLNQHEGFRAIRSGYDKQMSQMNKQLQALNAQSQAQARRAQQLEQELEQRTLAGADDYTKLEHHYKKESAARERLEQQLQQIQADTARTNFLKTVQEEFEVTLDDEEVSDPTQAIFALAHKQKALVGDLRKKIAEYERKVGAVSAAEEHAPDLGGGEPITISSIQRAYNQAMMALDGPTADKLVRQSVTSGVALDRYAWLKERNKK